jgi:hypothetical protein
VGSHKQPILGAVGACFAVVVSLAFIGIFDWSTFGGWVVYALMCSTPVTIIIGTRWAPPRAAFAQLSQPRRGLTLVGLAAAVGAAGLAVGFVTIGHGVSPPLPILSQFAVLAIPVTFWMSIMWGGWPFVLVPNRIVATATLVAACYALNYILFSVFARDGFLTGPTVDAFAVSCVAVMFLLLHFDLWPLTRLRGISEQPWRGIVWTAVVLPLGASVFLFGTQLLGTPAPVFMSRIPIPFIFGSILLLNTLKGSLFARLRQPVKGLVGALAAAALGTGLAIGYALARPALTGTLTSGPPSYQAATWLASALLGVTFLFLSFHNDFFDFWPFGPPAAKPDAPAKGRFSGSPGQGEPVVSLLSSG